jgi:hypothetical protein
MGRNPVEPRIVASDQKSEVEFPGANHLLELIDGWLRYGAREPADWEDLLSRG